MSAHNNILMKAEQAIMNWLASNSYTNSLNFYTGTSRGINADDTGAEQESNALPSVTVYADGGSESIPFTGNFDLNVSVEVVDNADETTRDAHETNAGEVFNQVITTTFPEDVSNNGTDFTVFGFVPGSVSSGPDGRRWKTSLSLTLSCCGSSL